MARIADIPKLAAEIKALLIKYDGVPSANVDRKAYAKIYASFKRYANEPEFINLIDEFKLNVIDSHYPLAKELEEVLVMMILNRRQRSCLKLFVNIMACQANLKIVQRMLKSTIT